MPPIFITVVGQGKDDDGHVVLISSYGKKLNQETPPSCRLFRIFPLEPILAKEDKPVPRKRSCFLFT